MILSLMTISEGTSGFAKPGLLLVVEVWSQTIKHPLMVVVEPLALFGSQHVDDNGTRVDGTERKRLGAHSGRKEVGRV